MAHSNDITMNKCPICFRSYTLIEIEKHVEKCIFLNQKLDNSNNVIESNPKRQKLLDEKNIYEVKLAGSSNENYNRSDNSIKHSGKDLKNHLQNDMTTTLNTIPLAEIMRPVSFDEYIGQNHVIGESKLLRTLLNSKKIPSMILWGPPGCGKTSLAHVISSICRDNKTFNFVKLSAAMAGVNDIKDVVKIAKDHMKYKKKTVLFMDEIHRFNKLQQDIFLPHVESGVITLIGATTENPSFSLNSALLSRCRVVVLEKLTSDNILQLLKRAVEEKFLGGIVTFDEAEEYLHNSVIRLFVEKSSLQWLSDISDGDARLALNSLEIAIQAKQILSKSATVLIGLDDIKDGIKRSHMLYDKKGDEHYNMISAVHKSIRASDENASLYWLTRMMQGGEDPLYIARRLVRIASEDIGLADPTALPLAVSCMQGCQMIGMPESDVLLAQCTIYLARAAKSQEAYHALLKCKQSIQDFKGAQPSVPLHLRNAPSKLMKTLGHGKGYNGLHKSISGLTYMPEEMRDVDFFS